MGGRLTECGCACGCVAVGCAIQYLLRTLNTVYNHSMVEWRRCGDSPQSQQDNYNACSNLWIQESAALACSTAYLHTDGARMDLTTFLNLSNAYYHGQPHSLLLSLLPLCAVDPQQSAHSTVPPAVLLLRTLQLYQRTCL